MAKGQKPGRTKPEPAPPAALDADECAAALATLPAFREALYTIACRSSYLQVSEDFILRSIASGELVARRHTSSEGRVSYRIEPDDWQRYLASRWPRTEARTPPSRT
jgi:hypothetical protein